MAKKILLALLFAAMLFSADSPIPITPHEGTQADPALVYASPTVAMCFDDTYWSLGISIVRVDVEIRTSLGNELPAWEFRAPFLIEEGAYKIYIRERAAELDNGLYQFRVRVWDSYGNTSEWSEVLWASKQWRTIERPGGCRTLP